MHFLLQCCNTILQERRKRTTKKNVARSDESIEREREKERLKKRRQRAKKSNTTFHYVSHGSY